MTKLASNSPVKFVIYMRSAVTAVPPLTISLKQFYIISKSMQESMKFHISVSSFTAFRDFFIMGKKKQSIILNHKEC